MNVTYVTNIFLNDFFWQASTDMEEIFAFIDNLNKRLSRPIKDLDDVRGSMAALAEIREAEIR